MLRSTFRDIKQSRHKGSHSLDFGRLDLRYEGKPLALNSDGCSGLIGQLFRATKPLVLVFGFAVHGS